MSVSISRHHQYDLKYRLGDLRHASPVGSMIVNPVRSPLLLVAPHSTTQQRSGTEKAAEFWTGAIVESLSEELGCGFVSTIGMRIEPENAASNDRLTQVLIWLCETYNVRWLIDIHGMSSSHDLDVCFGTSGLDRVNPVEVLANYLRPEFQVSIDAPFSGGNGLTSLVNASFAGTAAVQVELGPIFRSDTTRGSALDRLGGAIALLKDHIGSKSGPSDS